jgi:hypothetical protein
MKAITQIVRRSRALIILAIFALGLSVTAWAYWSAPSAGQASARVATLPAPTIESATGGAGTVALRWSAVTAPGGGAISYYVSRDGGSAGSGCPSASSPATQASCTETGVAPGSHTYTVTAVWRSWTAKSASAAAQVTAQGATHLVLAAATSSPSAGVADDLTITAKNDADETVTSYAGEKKLTFSGASAVGTHHPAVTDSSGVARELGTAETINFNAGVATTSGTSNGAMTLYKAETASIKVSDGTIENAGTPVTVAPAGATSLALSAPAGAIAGTAFTETLTALDSYGNTATSYSGEPTVTFSGPSSSPSGKAPSYAPKVKFSDGEGEAAIALYDAQTTTLSAVQGSLKGSSASFAVAPAEASSLSVPTPGTQTAGSAFNVTLTAKDKYGNTATSYAGSHAIGFSGPDESPGGKAPKYPASFSFSAGEATVAITLYDAQTMTLSASDGTISGSTGNFTVNAKSTTTQFGVSVPSGIVAGKEFSATLTAQDEYGNTTTGYTGKQTITFTGPSNSPNGKSPSYETSLTFSAGKATEKATLYDAQTTTLKASASFGAIVGASEGFTVASGAPISFTAANPGAQTAGTPFTLTIAGAKDTYGNAVSGTQPLSFSGPSNAPGGATPTYPPTAGFTGGEAKATITLVDAQTTSLKVTSAGASSTTSSFTVSAGPAAALSLAAATTTPTAGAPDNLTITAVDSNGNTATSYSGNKGLTFEGAASATNEPTVTNSSGTAIAFKHPTTISFASGVAKVSGSGNGVMKLYAVETAHVVVTDGSLMNGTGLAVTVEGAKISSLSLVNGNFGSSSKGKIEAGDSFQVDFGDPIAVNTICSAWSGNTTNHSFTGNGEVVVTLTDGGTGDDTLSVAASKCAFHLGTIDLGSSGYVGGGNATFSGNGSNASTITYTASTATLEVELGTKNGAGTVKQVTSSAATLTPDASLTDEFGNAYAPFTTSTSTQF